MNQDRIRLDITPKGKVTFTKTAVVAAVRLLEQRPNITMSCSSRELIDWAAKATWAQKKDDKYVIGIAWADPKFHEATCSFDIKYDKINMKPIPEVLPQIIADLIEKTDKVSVTELNDNFE